MPALRVQIPQVSEMRRVRKKFDEFDADGSGEIDGSEFKDMVAFFMKAKHVVDISDEKLKDYWEVIDTDKSGTVDFGEFVAWLMKEFPDYVAGGTKIRKTMAARRSERLQEKKKMMQRSKTDNK